MSPSRTRRDNVDYINDRKLAELPETLLPSRGEVTGDFPEQSAPLRVSLC